MVPASGDTVIFSGQHRIAICQKLGSWRVAENLANAFNGNGRAASTVSTQEARGTGDTTAAGGIGSWHAAQDEAARAAMTLPSYNHTSELLPQLRGSRLHVVRLAIGVQPEDTMHVGCCIPNHQPSIIGSSAPHHGQTVSEAPRDAARDAGAYSNFNAGETV
ncbi:hypothetical protein CCM_06872 [Cordyceps militaris CM01]|uniref:Uncharacterized protein n=1 Tax=Cordyceps militaris (strain CM01) TaxID=983644 RepID=G3JL78_CORMM|nr:uncharacterized protein CCM_06872 [Cordyceps militaris CM01]EGX90452.1 hypothetical protein CCM_06872 [Cordyceps militaris CM01]